ncbi:MAG: topoisomerase DNA-binding C4 zinc finger domain-containing protein [Nitrosomonas sp.]|nr:topoisomerase DNA-binding C4 zinc finger domain-containing protein [Nitrosomonas sp.]
MSGLWHNHYKKLSRYGSFISCTNYPECSISGITGGITR